MGDPFRFCDIELELEDLEIGGVPGLLTIVIVLAWE